MYPGRAVGARYRRIMGHGRDRLLRNLLGSLVVLALIVGVGLGLPAVDRAIPADHAIPEGRYQVAAGVSVVPPRGAFIDVTRTEPGEHEGSVLFLIGSVQYAVVVTPFDGTLTEAADRLRNKITAVTGYQIASGESAASTAAGVPGRQGVYVTPGADGRYAVFLADGLDVELTVAGGIVDLRRRLPALEESIRSLDFGGPA
jgi:hypothetical protein